MIFYINCNNQSVLFHLEQLEKLSLSAPLSFKVRNQIHEQLDLLLLQLQPSSNHAQDEIKERIVFLYGKTDDLCLEYETVAIFEKACAIEGMFGKESSKNLRKQLKELQTALSFLWKNFCPGLEERKKLSIAKHILQNGKRFLKGENITVFYENPFQQVDREEAFSECVNYLTNF